jgi:hypothetical protein
MFDKLGSRFSYLKRTGLSSERVQMFEGIQWLEMNGHDKRYGCY